MQRKWVPICTLCQQPLPLRNSDWCRACWQAWWNSFAKKKAA